MKNTNRNRRFGAGVGSTSTRPSSSSGQFPVSSLGTRDTELMSREDFLKGVSACALVAAAGMSAIGMGETVSAQSTLQSNYPQEDIFKTLAAVVDTIVPGKKNVPLIIMDQNFQPLMNNGSPVTLSNLGADGTSTTGAAGYVYFPPYFVVFENTILPAYPFLPVVLPQLAHKPDILDVLILTLDTFAAPLTPPGYPNPPIKFKDLPYEARYQIFYLMDKPDLLVPQLIQQFCQANPQLCTPYPPQQVIDQITQQAVAAKQLSTITIYATYFVYLSELCNVIPKIVDSIPVYQRNPDNTWPIIPNGIWYQMGYPGPSYKNPSYASTYDGLRVTISDGKVKIQ